MNAFLRFAEGAEAFNENLALFQAVHLGSQFQAQGGFLGVGKEGDPGFVIRIGADGAYGNNAS